MRAILFHKRKNRLLGPTEYSRWKIFRLLTFFFIFLLYFPIIVLIMYSFNNAQRNVVWRGFTWHYYVLAFHDRELFSAFINSLVIAGTAAFLSLILGTLAGYILWRFRFSMKGILESAIVLPIIAPEICVGVAMMIFFAHMRFLQQLPWPLSLFPIVAAHTAFCFPFVTLIIRARLKNFNKELIDAARDLGAGEINVLFDIILPHLTPALISGVLLSISLSLDDFIITFFTASPSTVTLPLKIYSMVRFGVTPEINAASTMLIVITVFVGILAVILQKNEFIRSKGSALWNKKIK